MIPGAQPATTQKKSPESVDLLWMSQGLRNTSPFTQTLSLMDDAHTVTYLSEQQARGENESAIHEQTRGNDDLKRCTTEFGERTIGSILFNTYS